MLAGVARSESSGIKHEVAAVTQERSCTTWTGDDDAAQAEALRILKMLGQKDDEPRHSKDTLLRLQKELELESTKRAAVEARVKEERGKADAAQKQVLCLEYELDSKEEQISNLQSTLDLRNSELQQAQEHIRALQVQLLDLQAQRDRDSSPLRRQRGVDGLVHVRSLREKIADREVRHAEKDRQIKQILAVIGQNRSDAFAEDDAMTMYGSELSLSGYTASSCST
jgi:chromosome segregation ATPase